LDRRHDRDILVRPEDVIASHEFDPRADKNSLIPRAQSRRLYVKIFEQLGHGRVCGKLDLSFANSRYVP
jgi:hypothetical protein